MLLVLFGPVRAHAAPGARPARPRQSARCQIVIILGKAARGALPRSLARFRRDLASRPFRQLGSFSLLGERRLVLTVSGRSRLHLVGPYRFEGRLLGRVARRARSGSIRFEAYLYRRRAGRKARRLLRTRLLATPGTTVLLAGPRYRHGRLIFALTCR